MIPRLLTLLVWLLWASPFGVHAAYAKRYGDLTFAASGQSLLDGNNMFTVIASNAYNAKITNNLAFNLPQSITLTHDLNGNMSGDGTRVFYHDAEDRLTNAFVPAQWKTEFVYDGLGRRRIIKDYAWQGGAWVKTNESRVIFDGMLPIQERDASNNVKVSYTRGLDLSGQTGSALNSAGGIGGLLARTDSNGSTFYHADGMGNVTALMDGNQNIVGRYLYDPFGRTLGQWGPMADANVMRFSSMPIHRQSGMVGYWGRFYDPALQRWIEQDPIQESGGINLYQFVGNNPINWIDPLGLLMADRYEEVVNRAYWADTPDAKFQRWLEYEKTHEGLQPDPVMEMLMPGGGIFFSGGASRGFARGCVKASAREAAEMAARETAEIAAMEAAERAAIDAAKKIAKEAAEQAAQEAAEAVLKAATKNLTKAESGAVTKINNILTKNFKSGPKGDISGAIHDMVGNPIAKPGGGVYDHVQDLGSMLRGLRNNVDVLKNSTNPAAVAARQQAQQAIEQMETAIKGAGL